MTRFPTAAHLVSWAGLCPSARQSGPRTRAGRKGQGDTWLRGVLGQAANGAARTQTFLSERYHRILRRRGKAKAQVAVARSILVIIWHLLKDPAARFTDLGPRLPPGPPQHRPQAPQPHPADPGPRLRRHHHQGRLNPHRTFDQAEDRTRPGSAAARPFPAITFRSVLTRPVHLGTSSARLSDSVVRLGPHTPTAPDGDTDGGTEPPRAIKAITEPSRQEQAGPQAGQALRILHMPAVTPRFAIAVCPRRRQTLSVVLRHALSG